MPTKKICPACGCKWSMEAVKFNECDSCGYPQIKGDFDHDLDPNGDFIPCSNCDGHDACRDFGCAIELMDLEDSDNEGEGFFDDFGNNALL